MSNKNVGDGSCVGRELRAGGEVDPFVPASLAFEAFALASHLGGAGTFFFACGSMLGKLSAKILTPMLQMLIIS